MNSLLVYPDKKSVLSECREFINLIGKEMSHIRLTILCRCFNASCSIDGQDYGDNILSSSVDIESIQCIKFYEFGHWLEDIRVFLEKGIVTDIIFNVGFDGEVLICDSSIGNIEANFDLYSF